jgi:chromosome segregation ATPase
VHERIDGLELRLDDLRSHSNQVEGKVDHLIAVLDAQRQLYQAELHDLSSQVLYLNSQVSGMAAQVRDLVAQVSDLKTQTYNLNSGFQDLNSRTEDLKTQAQHLVENDGAMLQGAIHIVESLHAIEPTRTDH